MIEIGGHSFEIGKRYKLSYTESSASSSSKSNNGDSVDKSSEDKIVLLQYKFKPVGLDPRGEGHISTSSTSEVKIRLPTLPSPDGDDGDDEEEEAVGKSWNHFRGNMVGSEITQQNEFILTVKPVSHTIAGDDAENDKQMNEIGHSSGNTRGEHKSLQFELTKVTTVVSAIRHVRNDSKSVTRRVQEVDTQKEVQLKLNQILDSNKSAAETASKTKGMKRKSK